MSPPTRRERPGQGAPETTHAAAVTAEDTRDGSPAVDVDKIRDWAHRMYGTAPGWVAVCSFPNRRYRHVEADNAGGIARAVAELGDTDQDVYLSAPTLHTRPPSGRGGADHAGALVDVWADIDIAGPTHKEDEGLPVDVAGAHRILDEIPGRANGRRALWRWPATPVGARHTVGPRHRRGPSGGAGVPAPLG